MSRRASLACDSFDPGRLQRLRREQGKRTAQHHTPVLRTGQPDADLDGPSTNTVDSTAEIAANAPRYRRKSSTFIDGIHDVSTDPNHMAPAQLYSTMSGRLFHSGRIAIVMVGLPARGKTYRP